MPELRLTFKQARRLSGISRRTSANWRWRASPAADFCDHRRRSLRADVCGPAPSQGSRASDVPRRGAVGGSFLSAVSTSLTRRAARGGLYVLFTPVLQAALCSRPMRDLTLVFSMLLRAALARAQFDTGFYLGTVRDSSGATVSDAKVTLTSTATGISATRVSASDGNYEFPAIEARRLYRDRRETGLRAGARRQRPGPGRRRACAWTCRCRSVSSPSGSRSPPRSRCSRPTRASAAR